MKRVAVTQLKAQCLHLVDNVQKTRKPLLITKRGKPIAKLVPVHPQDPEFFGYLEGILEVVGDIKAPAVPPEDWNMVRLSAKGAHPKR